MSMIRGELIIERPRKPNPGSLNYDGVRNVVRIDIGKKSPPKEVEVGSLDKLIEETDQEKKSAKSLWSSL